MARAIRDAKSSPWGNNIHAVTHGAMMQSRLLGVAISVLLYARGMIRNGLLEAVFSELSYTRALEQGSLLGWNFPTDGTREL